MSDKIKDNREQSPEELETIDDISRYSSLDALKDSEGGKILIDGLTKDVVDQIDKLATGCTTLTHTDLVGACIILRERLQLLRTLERSTDQKKYARSYLKKLVSDDSSQ